jgi:TonB family protein
MKFSRSKNLTFAKRLFEAVLVLTASSVHAISYAETRAQNEVSMFTVVGIEVGGQTVSRADDFIFTGTINKEPALKSMSLDDAFDAGIIRTPKNTQLFLRSLNGNMIRLGADSRLEVIAAHRAGERYSLPRGNAEFDVVSPLGFFQVESDATSVAARHAKFEVQQLDDDKTTFKMLRGRATLQRPLKLVIAEISQTTQKPIVLMSANLEKQRDSTPEFSNFPSTRFATIVEADAFFKNLVDVATQSKDDDRIAEALLSQIGFLHAVNKHHESIPAIQNRLAITAGDNLAQYDSMMRMADAFIALKDDNNAIAYLDQALKIISGPYSPKSSHNEVAIYKMFSDAYRRLGNEAAVARYENLYLASKGFVASPSYSPPKILKRTDMTYPKKMREWGLEGEVVVEAVVSPAGRQDKIRVVKSVHPAFESAVVRNALSTEFKPGTLDGNAVATTVRTPYAFKFTPISAAALNPTADPAAFKFAKSNVTGPVESHYDVAPQIKVVSLPAYPRNLLVERVTGSAKVVVALDRFGKIKTVAVINATHPEFGAATKAMLENWEFAPALKAGRPIPVLFSFEHQFAQNERDNGISDETTDALYQLKSKSAEIHEVVALDAAPKILYQLEAADPRKTFPKDNGVDTVQIEFIIDREGGVQLPRIVSATNMDLAWSVATVLQRWLFEVPKVKGTAVFARKEMLFEFR